MRTVKNLVYTLDFSEIGLKDIGQVGGKNASLGELFNALRTKGVGVIDGFATTADAYRALLAEGELEYESSRLRISLPSPVLYLLQSFMKFTRVHANKRAKCSQR